MVRGLSPADAADWPGEVLARIDWAQPWFAPWRAPGESVATDALARRSVAEALNQAQQPSTAQTRPSRVWHGPQAGSGDLASAASMSPIGLGAVPHPGDPADAASLSPTGLGMGQRPGDPVDAASLNLNGGGTEPPSSAHDPMRFVPQSHLPDGEAYEAFIGRTRQVPTRDGLHDFFNGLCWARFPRAKRRLNVLQCEAIARHGIQPQRGPLRDALTLFDENAVLLHAPDALWQALQRRDWHALFVDGRALWEQTWVVLFGHALLEKLITPYKSITGHVWRVAPDVPVGDEAALDAWLTHDLQADKLAAKPFEPLPVLGIPGWWPANAEPGFYADAQVFRPRRAASHTA